MTTPRMNRKPAENCEICKYEDMNLGGQSAPINGDRVLPSYLHIFIFNQFITYFQWVEPNPKFIATSYAVISAAAKPAHGLPGDNVGKGIVAYPIETMSYSSANELLNRALGRRRSPLKGATQ